MVCTVIASVTPLLCKKDMAKNQENLKTEQKKMEEEQKAKAEQNFTWVSYLIAILLPTAFLADVILMYLYQIRGGDATALIGGTAVAVMCIAAILQFGVDSLEKSLDYIRDGFMFGIKMLQL